MSSRDRITWTLTADVGRGRDMTEDGLPVESPRDFENILADGKEPVMTKEYKPLIPFQLQRYLNPQSLKALVLRDMQDLIRLYATTSNRPIWEVLEMVRAIIDEIGLERNLGIIRWCGMAITFIGKRATKGIYVNGASIERVKRCLGKTPVLYLPSHRSYMDFILMSYICFHYDIEIPGIAAGMDFHAMHIMGSVLRKTGAFFMRRLFSDDKLYWDVFAEYMYALVADYHIGVEFFVEGTRSRNFKALRPKIGLLAMALRPYFVGEVGDITVVPVSISYDRVLEERLFVYELLGVPKPKESILGLMKALRIVNENYGRMYFELGAPMSVRQFFGHTSDDRKQRASIAGRNQTLQSHEMEMIKRLANEVVYRQQHGIVITTFNMMSLVYCAHLYRHSTDGPLTVHELADSVLQVKELLQRLGANVATDEKRILEEIAEAEEIHSDIVHLRDGQLHLSAVSVQGIDTTKLKAHELSVSSIRSAIPPLSLQLYANPCLFWVARMAFLLLAAMQMKSEGKRRRGKNTLDELLQRSHHIYNIFKHEFILDRGRMEEDFRRDLATLQQIGVLHLSKDTIDVFDVERSHGHGYVILSAFVPFLLIYYQLTVTLNEIPKEQTFTPTYVFIAMQKRVEALLRQSDDNDNNNNNNKRYVHPYCLALDNVNIALFSLIHDGYLTKAKDVLRHSSARVPANDLKRLELQLLDYCTLMPFKYYYGWEAKIKPASSLSKL